MRLIFGRPIDKIGIESPIVCGGINSHECLIGGQGVLGITSDFDPIDMKFGMEVVFDILIDYLKFGPDKLISCSIWACT